MAQVNLPMKQKQTHRHREQTCGCQGGGWVGDGWTGSLGLVDANYYIYWVGQKVRSGRPVTLYKNPNELFGQTNRMNKQQGPTV